MKENEMKKKMKKKFLLCNLLLLLSRFGYDNYMVWTIGRLKGLGNKGVDI